MSVKLYDYISYTSSLLEDLQQINYVDALTNINVSDIKAIVLVTY